MATGAQRLPLMPSKTYEALRAAGAPEDKARAAAEELASGEAGWPGSTGDSPLPSAGVAGPETSPVDLRGCDQRRRHDDDACQALVTALLRPVQLEGLTYRLSLHRPRVNLVRLL